MLYCALGKHWNDDSGKFLTEATYYYDDYETELFGRKYKFTKWTIILGPGAPGEQISEDEFPTLN